MRILVVVLIITGVMQGIGIGIKQVSIENVPELLLPFWKYIVLVVGSTPWIVLAGFGRNVLGFARVYFRKDRLEAYDYNKLYETLTLYLGSITTIVAFTATLPEPWNEIGSAVGSAIVIVVDLVRSEISHLRE